jgi:endoglucanase
VGAVDARQQGDALPQGPPLPGSGWRRALEGELQHVITWVIVAAIGVIAVARATALIMTALAELAVGRAVGARLQTRTGGRRGTRDLTLRRQRATGCRPPRRGASVCPARTTSRRQMPAVRRGATARRAARRRLVLALGMTLVAGAVFPWPEPSPVYPRGYLHSAGAQIVNAAGEAVQLKGVSWFGFETTSFAPHGLDVRNWQGMLDQMARAGFNTIRLPYSNQLFDPASVPSGINYDLNPDLKGLRGLALMDKIIQGAGQRGINVILDRHRPDAYAQSELWYTDQVPESRWIADWVMLARHYRGNSTVIGADLDNEPRGPATWGSGNRRTDWRLAAERAGNAILRVNPDWLIIVEGIENFYGDYYWWGGNLEGARWFPVRLSHPEKLVYSTHDYGPEIYEQAWFLSHRFPRNLPSVWEEHWAYLQTDGIAPVYVGEFGGRSMGQDAGGTWQRSLVAYLGERRISYTYWSWNPDSSDTGGVLNNDWRTVDPSKLHNLDTPHQDNH